MLGGLTTKLIIGGVALAIVSGAFWWLNGILDDNATLHANNAVLVASVATQRETIQALQDNIDRMAKIQESTNAELSKIRADAAQDRFAGHDFGHLLERKPGLVSKIINDGWVSYYKSFHE